MYWVPSKLISAIASSKSAHQIVHSEARGSFGDVLTYCSIAAALTLTILILVPFAPAYPSTGLDASWVYALNTAVADHLRFGKDIIFTLGPLASIYTRLYSPQTDALMMLGSFLIAAALMSGLFFAANETRRPWLLLIPLAISQFALLDAIFITLPALLVCVCDSKRSACAAKRISIFAMSAACGVLTLVKGSATPPTFVCMLLAASALWTESRRDAVLLIAVAIGAMAAGWLSAGQSLADIPSYFRGQDLVTAGYSNGMSTTGRDLETLVYLLVTAVLVWLSCRADATKSWRVGLALTVVLFIGFKAGFVRHDGHAIIAGTALFLAGYFIFLMSNARFAFLALALGTFGWLFISARYVDWHPRSISDRLYNGFVQSAFGLEARIMNESTLKQRFDEAVANIKRTHPLPAYGGTADIYPTDDSILIANGANWAPRPVFQSYVAYTPALSSLNRDHLVKSPPSRIYFGIASIDGRYPSLEDGLSWPQLLSNYEPLALRGDTAVLQKRKSPSAVKITGPILEETRMLGTQISLPNRDGPIWAEVDLEPTWLGRLASAAYKDPLLFITLRYHDGSSRSYRFIAGMGRAGFLLSPTVESARDFVALQSTNSKALFAEASPTDFTISGKNGTNLLWARSLNLKLYAVDIPADPRADSLLVP